MPKCKQVPHEFKCPITHEIMEKPVTTIKCGHTFDADAIYNWVFCQNQNRCPCCNGEVKIPDAEVYFRANDSLKAQIERYKRQQEAYYFLRNPMRLCFS